MSILAKYFQSQFKSFGSHLVKFCQKSGRQMIKNTFESHDDEEHYSKYYQIISVNGNFPVPLKICVKYLQALQSYTVTSQKYAHGQ